MGASSVLVLALAADSALAAGGNEAGGLSPWLLVFVAAVAVIVVLNWESRLKRASRSDGTRGDGGGHAGDSPSCTGDSGCADGDGGGSGD